MKLTLIRHSTTKPTSDIPICQWGLTNEGVKLADKLSVNHLIKDLDVIYSSLQTKALETALIVAKPNAIAIKTHPDLTEISSFTIKFLGDEFDIKLKQYFDNKISRINGGETYKEALSRFDRALTDIVDQEKENKVDNIGVVTHGYVLSFFTARYCNLGAWEVHEKISMPDIATFDWEMKKLIKFWGEAI
jgi:broad specificity phosphatase PhoE